MLCFHLSPPSRSLNNSLDGTCQTPHGNPTDACASHVDPQLWVLATLAFTVFFSNYMVAPLIPAFSREFSVPASQLGWLTAGYLIPYGISTLVYGALSDRWGRASTLTALLGFAATTLLLVSVAGSWQTLVVARVFHRSDGTSQIQLQDKELTARIARAIG